MEWLTDDDNRELEDEIEAVNFRMLDKLLETSPLIAVFFCMYSFITTFTSSKLACNLIRIVLEH